MLMRFVQADTLVPEPGNPQSLNRFAYVLNNPVRYTDPTGHRVCEDPSDCNGEGGDPYSPPTTTPVVPVNPWRYELITEKDWLRFLSLTKSAEQEFLDTMKLPIDGNYFPFGGPNTLGGGGRHAAVDTRGVTTGAPVHAAAYGQVVAVGFADFGNYVLIKHQVYGETYYSVYAHLNTQTVEIGDTVDVRTQIGTVGDTARFETSAHLHFEVRKATNVNLDPVHVATHENGPFGGEVWWPETYTQLKQNFVDLGPIFGYHSTFEEWKRSHP